MGGRAGGVAGWQRHGSSVHHGRPPAAARVAHCAVKAQWASGSQTWRMRDALAPSAAHPLTTQPTLLSCKQLTLQVGVRNVVLAHNRLQLGLFGLQGARRGMGVALRAVKCMERTSFGQAIQQLGMVASSAPAVACECGPLCETQGAGAGARRACGATDCQRCQPRLRPLRHAWHGTAWHGMAAAERRTAHSVKARGLTCAAWLRTLLSSWRSSFSSSCRLVADSHVSSEPSRANQVD